MKSLGKIAVLMGLIIGSTFVGLYFLKLFGLNEGGITRLIPFASMLVWVVIFLKIIDNRKLSDIGLYNFKDSMKMNIIMVLLSLLPILVGIILTRELKISKSIDTSLFFAIPYYFLVGFSEELLCRGYIYNTIEFAKLKPIVSALAFAGFHFISPEFGLGLFIILVIFGLIKAFMYKVIQNLWPLIVFHMIWDLGANYTKYYTNPLIDLICLAVSIFIIKFISKENNKVNRIIKNA